MMKSHSPIVLRTARESDLEELRGLIHRTIDARYRGVYPEAAVAFFKGYHSGERILERIRYAAVVVLERENRLIGTGSLVGDEILGVFVSPDHQGRGYGRRIMATLEARARERNLPAVTLSVSLPAVPFYRALGYTMLKPRFLEMPGGERLDYFEAWKVILSS